MITVLILILGLVAPAFGALVIFWFDQKGWSDELAVSEARHEEIASRRRAASLLLKGESKESEVA